MSGGEALLPKLLLRERAWGEPPRMVAATCATEGARPAVGERRKHVRGLTNHAMPFTCRGKRVDLHWGLHLSWWHMLLRGRLQC